MFSVEQISMFVKYLQSALSYARYSEAKKFCYIYLWELCSEKGWRKIVMKIEVKVIINVELFREWSMLDLQRER